MKGKTTIQINQATMVEAIQQYFDKQLASAHTVKSVLKDKNVYSDAEGFVVEFCEVEEVQP